MRRRSSPLRRLCVDTLELVTVEAYCSAELFVSVRRLSRWRKSGCVLRANARKRLVVFVFRKKSDFLCHFE